MARTTASLNVLLALRTEGIGKALDVANKQLNRFARQAKAAGEQMTMSFTLPAAVIGGSAIKAFADMEKLEKSLTAIAGSSQAAQEQLGRLRTLALEPGIDLEQAVQASIRLQTVGYAAEEAERTILQMSKAITLAGGTADDLNEVVRQMTQMESKNKILAEDFEVIKDRIPNIGIALQKAFNTTSIEAIRESGISVREFNERLVQAIATSEVYQSVQGGTANAITNFQSALRQALATVGKAINENANITAILDKLTAIVNKLADGFADLSPRMQAAILTVVGLTAVIGPLLIGLGGIATVLPMLTAGFTVLGSVVSLVLSPITLAVAGIAAFAAGVIKAYNDSAVFRDSVSQLGNAFLELLGAAKRIAMAIGEIPFRIAGMSSETTKFSASWKEMFGIFVGVTNVIIMRLKHLVDVISNTVDFITKLLQGDFGGADASAGKALASLFSTINLNEIKSDFLGAYNEIINSVPTEEEEEAKAPASLTDEQRARTAFLGNKRRTDAMATPAALPSLAPQILEAGKLALANDAVTLSNKAMAESFADVTEGMSKAMPNFERLNEISFEMPTFLDTFASATEKITDSFVNLAEQGTTSIREFAVAAVRALRQVIGEVIRLGVANAIEMSLKNAVIAINPALIPVIAGAAGALAKTAFNGILNAIKVPALATGGLAYGPTMALVGDNPGARSNPEVIAPLSKLQGMLEQSGGMAIGEFRLRGEDLLLSVTRTQNRQNRYK